MGRDTEYNILIHCVYDEGNELKTPLSIEESVLKKRIKSEDDAHKSVKEIGIFELDCAPARWNRCFQTDNELFILTARMKFTENADSYNNNDNGTTVLRFCHSTKKNRFHMKMNK